MNIIEIILNALKLIISGNKLLYEVIFLSLRVSLTALFISSSIAIVVGYVLALKKFYFKSLLLILINSLMGIPPVVVGLIVYFLFAYGGPLGTLKLIYTPTAMIIAQVIIIFPIVTSLSHEIFSQNWKQYKDQFRSLNIPFFGIIKILGSKQACIPKASLLGALEVCSGGYNVVWACVLCVCQGQSFQFCCYCVLH